MEMFGAWLSTVITAVGTKLILALLVWVIGKAVVKKLVELVVKSKGFASLDETVKAFAKSFITILLYIVLVISIIGILGVPMASVVTVLASAGVAVGLALQGALSNLAGGIMLMIFRPFSVGDYVSAGGVEGVIKEVTMFYTVVMTLDNRRVTVPNGTLMNANVENYSTEETRRVDLVFTCAKGEDIKTVTGAMKDVMNANDKVLKDPEPFARLSGGTNEAMEFTVRAWCKGADYWDVYFDLTEGITEALGKVGVKAPALRVVTDKQ